MLPYWYAFLLIKRCLIFKFWFSSLFEPQKPVLGETRGFRNQLWIDHKQAFIISPFPPFIFLNFAHCLVNIFRAHIILQKRMDLVWIITNYEECKDFSKYWFLSFGIISPGYQKLKFNPLFNVLLHPQLWEQCAGCQ